MMPLSRVPSMLPEALEKELRTCHEYLLFLPGSSPTWRRWNGVTERFSHTSSHVVRALPLGRRQPGQQRLVGFLIAQGLEIGLQPQGLAVPKPQVDRLTQRR
jgi:hypothetical protein